MGHQEIPHTTWPRLYKRSPLSLPHECQLQAIAVQDTCILFLQPGTSSILPVITQATQTWKQNMEQKKATQSLRLTLITLIAPTLLDRMLKVTQSQWKFGKKLFVTSSLQKVDAGTDRQTQVMSKTSISMTSTESLLEELVETKQLWSASNH